MKRPRRDPSTSPPDASRVGRRELLGGAALAGAALLGCGPKADRYRIDKPALRTGAGGRAGEERWVPTTCTLCEAGCGITVRVVEGRAVKIEGNPDHPSNRGGLCSRGQAGLQLLYHPERVRSPLRRVGARGAGQWQAITWDEALAELSARLGRLRAEGHPERLVLVDGEAAGFTHDLWARFLDAFGSRNHVCIEPPISAGVGLAARYMWDGLPAYDWEHARFVLALGSEGLESSGQALRLWQAAAAPAAKNPGGRPRVTCVAPRRPVCRVDEWIPMAPGSEGALALSLAHVLIRDGLIDKDFVRERVVDHLSGNVLEPEATAQRLKRSALDWIRAEWGPERAARETGVSAMTIERLAHDLASKRPAIVAGMDSGASNGLASGMAIFSLNALLGNLQREGGVFLRHKPRLKDWAATERDAVSRQAMSPRIDGVGTAACPLGHHRVQAIPAAIGEGKPHPVEALLLHRADPLGTLPGRQAWAAALHKVPFVVSFSSRFDQSSLLADMILPEAMPAETWDVTAPAPVPGLFLMGLCQPVVAPVHDVRPAGAIILALAAGMGGSIRSALPWQSYQDAVAVRLQGLLDGEDEDSKSLLGDMREKGGWWREAGPGEGQPSGPGTGKFWITSFSLSFLLGRKRETSSISSQWPCEGLPPWEPARYSGSPAEYPLQLVPYRSLAFVDSHIGLAPWLSELPVASGNPWPARAEIHPSVAERLGVADGDHVLVQSPVGSCEAVARVSEGVHAGAVAMALGKREVLDLIVPDEDRLSGLLAWHGTRVRVRKRS